jgi:hypothetical protein
MSWFKGLLGGQGLPGLLGLGTNLLNVGLQWKLFQEAKDKQEELLGKAEESLGGVTAAYDKYFPQMKSQAQMAYEDAAANTRDLQRQNEANRASALAEWANLTDSTVRGMDEDTRRLLADYDYNAQLTQDQYARDRAGILADYDTRSQGLIDDYQNRLNTGMGYLEGQGEQGKRDILEQARINEAAAAQQLARSGFGGGQFLAASKAGQTREATNALNRLNEALAAQKFDAYSGLSGDLLGAKGDWITNRTGMQSETSNNQRLSRENWLTNRTNMDLTNTQNRQKTQQGMNVEGFNIGQDYADRGMDLLAQEGADRAAYNQQLSNLLGTEAQAYAGAAGSAANMYAGYNVEMPDLSGALSGLANDFNTKGASVAQQKAQRRAKASWWDTWGPTTVETVTESLPI